MYLLAVVQDIKKSPSANKIYQCEKINSSFSTKYKPKEGLLKNSMKNSFNLKI